MELVEVNPKKREDNSAPIFVAFQKKIIDIAASPIAIKAEKLKAGDVIGPVWPMRYVIYVVSHYYYYPKDTHKIDSYTLDRVFYFVLYHRPILKRNNSCDR